MIAVTSPGFVLFAALLAGLWYACPPPRRWQLLLGANLLFYAVLCPAALPVLAGSSFLVWWCGRRTAKKPVFLAGLAAALLPLGMIVTDLVTGVGENIYTERFLWYAVGLALWLLSSPAPSEFERLPNDESPVRNAVSVQ